MKKGIALSLAILQIFWLINPIFSQDEFKIIKIKDDNLVANRGSNQNIELNQKYHIIRQDNIIGIARVVVLKPDICGLIQISGEKIYVGDKLQLIAMEQDIFQEMNQIKIQRQKANRAMIVGVLFIIGGATLAIIGMNRKEKIKVNNYTIEEKKNPDETLIIVGGTMTLVGIITLASVATEK